MTKICTFDGSYASFSIAGGPERVTTRAVPGRYIFEDLGKGNSRQMLSGWATGNALTWDRDPARMGQQFADDIGAKLVSEAELQAALAVKGKVA